MFARTLARPLLASAFISGGLDTLRNPASRVPLAEPVVDRLATAVRPVAEKLATASTDAVASVADAAGAAAEAASTHGEAAAQVTTTAEGLAEDLRHGVQEVAAGAPLPFQTETYVKANAAVQVGAGLLLATGRAPRLASAALAATIVPTTLAGHRFWEAEGDERAAQQAQFAKNVSLLGGLLLAAVDTEGRPGLAWRAGQARKQTRLVAKLARANARSASRAARLDAIGAGRTTRSAVRSAGRAAARSAGANATTAAAVSRRGAHAASRQLAATGAALAPRVEVIGARGHELAERGQAAISPRVHDTIHDLAPRVQALVPLVQEKVQDLAPKAAAAGQALGTRVAERASLATG